MAPQKEDSEKSVKTNANGNMDGRENEKKEQADLKPNSADSPHPQTPLTPNSNSPNLQSTPESSCPTPRSTKTPEGNTPIDRDLTSVAQTVIPLPLSNDQVAFQARSGAFGPFFSDILTCAIIGILFIVVPKFTISPRMRDFHCQDYTIRYPYATEKVSQAFLFVICASTLLMSVLGTEVYRTIKFTESAVSSRFIIRSLTYLAHGIFGVLITLMLTETVKYSAGRLRPHFIDVCQPNVSKECLRGRIMMSFSRYNCIEKDPHVLKQIHLSFFSGHAAIAMTVAVYCALYMQARLPRRVYGITLLPIFHNVLLIGALLVGLSRVADNMHHWSDVLVGFIVGAGVGYYTAVILARVFERTDLSYKKEDMRPSVECDSRAPDRTDGASTRTTSTFVAASTARTVQPMAAK